MKTFYMEDFPRVVEAASSLGYAEFLRRDGFKTTEYIGNKFEVSYCPSHCMSEEEYTWFVLRWS